MLKFDEGYIKFNLIWKQKPFDFSDDLFYELNSFREKLFKLGLIGVYPDGIGYGNISIRFQNNDFIISGSATGEFENLTKDQYALVTDFNIAENSVYCIGLTKASSESMSHAAIYKSNSKVNAVIHIHQLDLWEKYKNQIPTTDEKAAFGTPEMAFEIQKLAKHNSGIIIMGGHCEGIITYGQTLDEAYNILLKYLNEK